MVVGESIFPLGPLPHKAAKDPFLHPLSILVGIGEGGSIRPSFRSPGGHVRRRRRSPKVEEERGEDLLYR